MASLESINDLLEQASKLLDQVAQEIRDAPLKPTTPNILHIAKALSEIFELQLQIYALQPALTPVYLKTPSSHPEKTFEVVLRRVAFFEETGELATAIGFLQFFVAHQISQPHIERARHEIARLKAKSTGT